MSRFKLITVSKDKSQKIEDINSFNIESKHQVQHIKVNDNSLSLAKVYNQYLKQTRADNDTDFLIFMHADVSLDLNSFLNHIEECKNKYDIIGLCGTSIFNVSQSPLNWWTSSNPTPQSKWGCVTHGELGNQMSFFSHHSPDVTDHEVACIDGLCIVFGPKAISSSIEFDEIFTFDFYDSDISLQAIMKYRMKLGVIVEKSLQHYSVGKSILTQEFLMHEIDFRKKWNLEIPPNSPINQMFNNSK